MNLEFEKHVGALSRELRLRDDQLFLAEQGCTIASSDSDLFLELFPALDDRSDCLFHSGLDMIKRSGVRIAEGVFDPAGAMIGATLVDGVNIALGLTPDGLEPIAPLMTPHSDFPLLLADTCSVHRLPSGRKAHVGSKPGRPLLLIGALGVPAFFWAHFLHDQKHGWQPILVELRCGDLLEGGMTTDQSLLAHADDLAATVRHLGVGPVTAVGWCNAGRVAVALARIAPELIDALILLGTTFRGTIGIKPRPSLFEDNLDRLFRDLLRKPGQAPFATRMIRNMVLNAKAETSGIARAQRFLGSARADAAEALIAPMNSATDLLNYARRTAADESQDMAMILSETRVPTLALTGDCDGIINTAVTRDAVALIPASRHLELQGAGHYLHDLQYRYVKETIARFIANPAGDLTGGRIRLRDLQVA